MKHAAPPSAATWLLERWSFGGRNDCLAGDLLEEFHSGRTSGWYWRQVLAALSNRGSREVFTHRAVLLFAVLWSMLVPLWLLAVAALEQHFNLDASFRQMDFPWSVACDVGLTLAANIVFVWMGILAYLIPHLWVRKILKFRHLAQGILASVPVLIALSAALIVLPQSFLHAHAANRSPLPVPAHVITEHRKAEVQRVLREWSESTHHTGVTSHADNPGHEIIDLRNSSLLLRLPFLLCLLLTLWGVSSRFRKSERPLTV